jgi:hypothetical protein
MNSGSIASNLAAQYNAKKAASQKLRNTIFLGECNCCGREIRIDSFLSPAEKREYVESYGTKVVKGKTVCNYVAHLENCHVCARKDFC